METLLWRVGKGDICWTVKIISKNLLHQVSLEIANYKLYFIYLGIYHTGEWKYLESYLLIQSINEGQAKHCLTMSFSVKP